MALSPGLGEVHEVETSAGRLRYRETGAGPPVLFIHGLFVNGDLWRDVVPVLAPHCRCIVPDWPLGAHELGMDPRADLSLPGAATLVDEVMTALGLEDVTLVGNDTGGAIVQAVLGRHPDRVGRAVITPCDAFDNFPPRILLHLKHLGRFAPMVWVMGQMLRVPRLQRLPIAFGYATRRPIEQDVMRSYTEPARVNRAARRDFAAVARRISKRHTMEAAERLRGFDKPVLVVWTRDDRLFPLAHGRRLAGLLPHARFEVIEDSGAFVPEDRPQALAELIKEFVVSSTTGAGEGPDSVEAPTPSRRSPAEEGVVQ